NPDSDAKEVGQRMPAEETCAIRTNRSAPFFAISKEKIGGQSVLTGIRIRLFRIFLRTRGRQVNAGPQSLSDAPSQKATTAAGAHWSGRRGADIIRLPLRFKL